MKNKTLLVSSGILTMLWGISHIIPTNSIVVGFGDISVDNKRIIFMEWINEGFTLIFIGSLILLVTLIKTSEKNLKKAVYLLSFVMLISMAILSLFTGFKVNFIAFRLCPVIFTLSAIPLLLYYIRNSISSS